MYVVFDHLSDHFTNPPSLWPITSRAEYYHGVSVFGGGKGTSSSQRGAPRMSQSSHSFVLPLTHLSLFITV